MARLLEQREEEMKRRPLPGFALGVPEGDHEPWGDLRETV
jgi:hypothetical protein